MALEKGGLLKLRNTKLYQTLNASLLDTKGATNKVLYKVLEGHVLTNIKGSFSYFQNISKHLMP